MRAFEKDQASVCHVTLVVVDIDKTPVLDDQLLLRYPDARFIFLCSDNMKRELQRDSSCPLFGRFRSYTLLNKPVKRKALWAALQGKANLSDVAGDVVIVNDTDMECDVQFSLNGSFNSFVEGNLFHNTVLDDNNSHHGGHSDNVSLAPEKAPAKSTADGPSRPVSGVGFPVPAKGAMQGRLRCTRPSLPRILVAEDNLINIQVLLHWCFFFFSSSMLNSSLPPKPSISFLSFLALLLTLLPLNDDDF